MNRQNEYNDINTDNYVACWIGWRIGFGDEKIWTVNYFERLLWLLLNRPLTFDLNFIKRMKTPSVAHFQS